METCSFIWFNNDYLCCFWNNLPNSWNRSLCYERQNLTSVAPVRLKLQRIRERLHSKNYSHFCCHGTNLCLLWTWQFLSESSQICEVSLIHITHGWTNHTCWCNCQLWPNYYKQRRWKNTSFWWKNKAKWRRCCYSVWFDCKECFHWHILAIFKLKFWQVWKYYDWWLWYRLEIRRRL